MGFLSSAAGNLTGGIIGTSDAERAASKGAKLSRKTKKAVLAELRGALDLAEEDIQPFVDSGLIALEELNELKGGDPEAPELTEFSFDPSSVGESDAFKFRFDLGQQATDRAIAANRGLTSGNRLLALQDFGQRSASQEFENEFNRQFRTNQANNQTRAGQFALNQAELATAENRLNNLVNIGQGASTNLAGFRLGTAGNISNALTQNAANQFSASLIPAQEKQNLLGSIFGAAGSAGGFGKLF